MVDDKAKRHANWRRLLSSTVRPHKVDMDKDQKDVFLKDEYLLLQGFYVDFDRSALMVKGWSVTVAIAGLAVGFEKGIPGIWVLVGVAALMFWIIDGKWRMYQYANRKRIKEIKVFVIG